MRRLLSLVAITACLNSSNAAESIDAKAAPEVKASDSSTEVSKVKTTQPNPSPLSIGQSVGKISFWKGNVDSDILTVIAKPIQEPSRISSLVKNLESNSVMLPSSVADGLGCLCYVAFEEDGRVECAIARMQIAGPVLMLKGSRKGDFIEIDWDKDATFWKCNSFALEILDHVKAFAPDHLKEMNAFFVEVTGSTVEKRMIDSLNRKSDRK